jgi:peptidylprolyl isomerase
MKTFGQVALLFALAGCASSSASTSTTTGSTTTASSRASANPPGYVPRTSLGVVDLRVGSGQRAFTGACLYVHYEGALPNGETFETSRKPRADGKTPEPIVFELGAGMVMPGWEKGLVGMSVGGRRQLWIPFSQAYGAAGKPPAIPRRTDLIFDIELLAAAPPLAMSSNAPRADGAKNCPSWASVRR